MQQLSLVIIMGLLATISKLFLEQQLFIGKPLDRYGDNMKKLLRKQMNNREYIVHSFMKDMVKVSVYQYSKWNEDDSDEDRLTEEYYYDLSNIEHGKVYYSTEYLYEPKRDNEGVLYIELLSHYTSDSEDDESLNPEWQDVEFEDFEIPEDAEIIQLEELIIPEPEPSPVDNLVRENAELKRSIDSLRSSMIQNNKNTEDLIVTLLAMM